MKYTTKYLRNIVGGFIIAGSLAAGHIIAADTPAGSSISSKASDFIKDASLGNQSEITMAQLAQQKAQNSEVKDLAQMIQQDHQQAQAKLQNIAQAHGVALDQTPGWNQRRRAGTSSRR